ncbi:hypothetical protein BD414DRAFT_166080 [Trametes punicea]|nr:hypothetical protein BD414DRAFT_166080 [Trametes punicea]
MLREAAMEKRPSIARRREPASTSGTSAPGGLSTTVNSAANVVNLRDQNGTNGASSANSRAAQGKGKTTR